MSKKWFLIACFGLAAAGCKQGLGDRCQIDATLPLDSGSGARQAIDDDDTL